MSKDDATWLNIALAAFLFAVSYVAYKAFETVGIQFSIIEKYQFYGLLSSAGGLVVGAGATYLLRKPAERREFLLASIAELRKVEWPTWDVTKKLTVIVCIVVAIVAVAVALMDALWAGVLKSLLEG